MIKLGPLSLQIETKRLEKAVKLAEMLLIKLEDYNKMLVRVNEKIRKIERFVDEFNLKPRELRKLIAMSDETSKTIIVKKGAKADETNSDDKGTGKTDSR